MPSTKIQNLINLNLFKIWNAFVIATSLSIILTGIMMLANMNEEWVLNKHFHLLFAFINNTLITFSVLSYSFIIIKSRLELYQKHLWAIIGSIILAILISLLSNWIHTTIHNDPQFSDTGNVYLTRDIGTAVVSILFALILYSLSRRHQHRIEREQLLTENLQVRYEALKNQLDPHFLFNSLNTLSALIEDHNDRAQSYLHHLANSYRYIMQSHRLVDLDEEMQFVKSYCKMLEMRYGDNIRFERNIERHKLQYQVIPISIQLLIENAVKHNVVSQRYPLVITLSTTPYDTFRVSNPIRPKQETSTNTGLGLSNLAKRYKLLCNKEITISDRDGIFSVELPLLNPIEATKIFNNQSLTTKK